MAGSIRDRERAAVIPSAVGGVSVVDPPRAGQARRRRRRQGCGAIHQRGFVHHDAKLENMMWGPAAAAAAAASCRSTSTPRNEYAVGDYGALTAIDRVRPWRPVGTPGFMSPLLVRSAAADAPKGYPVESIGERDRLWRSAGKRASDRLNELLGTELSAVDPAIVDFHSMGASIADMAADLGASGAAAASEAALRVAGILLRCHKKDRASDLIDRVSLTLSLPPPREATGVSRVRTGQVF